MSWRCLTCAASLFSHFFALLLFESRKERDNRVDIHLGFELRPARPTVPQIAIQLTLHPDLILSHHCELCKFNDTLNFEENNHLHFDRRLIALMKVKLFAQARGQNEHYPPFYVKKA